jgi:hypothetical protein
MADVGKDRSRYDASINALEFELEHFWKRSLFFWGFIGAALVAFSAADKHPSLQGLIASFGFVCSMVWTLVNRGSKYWYEKWESKVGETEMAVTGHLYGDERVEEKETECLKKWLQGRRYSPSRLTIALSDYVVVLWFGLLVYTIIKIVLGSQCPYSSEHCFKWVVSIFMLVSFVFAVSLAWICHKNPAYKK